MDPKVFESALSSLGESIAIFEPSGILLWVNPAAEHLFGISSARMLGKPAHDIFKSSQKIATEMERAWEQGYAIFDNETSFTSLSGQKFPVSVSIHPMEEEKGGRGLVVVLRDLTGLKAMERSVKLRQKVDETSTLVAGIAHEIKNPLSGIRGAAQLAQKETGPEAFGEYAGLIIRETDRINRLITDLIDLNNPGLFPMASENVYWAIDEAIMGISPQASKRSITIEKVYDPSLPNVMANKDKLVQIFLNLIKNAMEANPDNSRIIIQSGPAWRLPDGAPPRKGRKYAAIAIIDEGSGIDRSDMDGIFTPFFTRKNGGTGMGLAVTMNLVRSHDGLLTVENRNKKNGVRAAVYLPLA